MGIVWDLAFNRVTIEQLWSLEHIPRVTARISAWHDRKYWKLLPRRRGNIQCKAPYKNWLTDSLLSDTHSSVKFGKHSRFSSIVICWPIRVRLCRLGKFSMPIIFGKPEKNISKDLTFFPDPFCNFSNLTPFTAHYSQKKWAAITGHWVTKGFLTYTMSRLCSGKNWLGSQQYLKLLKYRVPSISMKKLRFSSLSGEGVLKKKTLRLLRPPKTSHWMTLNFID